MTTTLERRDAGAPPVAWGWSIGPEGERVSGAGLVRNARGRRTHGERHVCVSCRVQRNRSMCKARADSPAAPPRAMTVAAVVSLVAYLARPSSLLSKKCGARRCHCLDLKTHSFDPSNPLSFHQRKQVGARGRRPADRDAQHPASIQHHPATPLALYLLSLSTIHPNRPPTHPRKQASKAAMSGNFFRGTTHDQDARFGAAEKKLLSKMSFAKVLGTKVSKSGRWGGGFRVVGLA